ncbi:hypothetical protein SDC9_147299 [bioreactor metagenome]|uniref:Uncharacterized protein n=1 Tax=bioreactor metagenome TaxID=1076179 RepID=A0A645EDH3_9ZZZZ
MPAAETFQFDIHSDPQDFPALAAAGMLFFQFHLVVKMQVHEIPPVNPPSHIAYSGTDAEFDAALRGGWRELPCRKIKCICRRACAPAHP